MSIEGKPAK
jgi:hypothetical protein